MGNLDEAIDMATRRVEEGRRIVEKQRKLIAERRGGPDAIELLRNFELSLEIFEGDLERLLAEKAKHYCAPDACKPVPDPAAPLT